MIPPGNLGVGEEEESSLLGISILNWNFIGFLDYGESISKSRDTKVGHNLIISFHNF
jgi:hypothetical protein